jgi:acetaldehyde dehydrogenase (acetylating)
VIPTHDPAEPPFIAEQSLYVITDPAGQAHMSAFPEMSVAEKSGTYMKLNLINNLYIVITR